MEKRRRYSKRFKTAKEAQEFKRKTRRKPEWAELRSVVFERQKGLDPVTKKKLRKGWALHHLDTNPDHYDDLSEEKFVGLNYRTHETIHFLYDYGLTTNDFNPWLYLMHKEETDEVDTEG